MTFILILAGGQGTRLGGADKAFLLLHNQPLIGHLLARLRPQARRIAISANGDPARFAAYGVPVLADEISGRGPLAGVAAGLRWARDGGAKWLLTVPVDTPMIPDTLLASLSPGPSVAAYAGRQHHLVAIWPVSFLAELQNFLGPPGDYRVRDALGLCRARPVGFAAAADPFLNINTPGDLATAARSLADKR